MSVSSPPPVEEAVASSGPWLSADLRPALGVLATSAVLMLLLGIFGAGGNVVAQISAILVTAIFLAIAAFGEGLAILLGGIDLSIGVVMGLGGMMISNLTNGSDDALIWALPATLAACTGIGLLNGIGIAIGGVPPFIMTLASATTFFGVGLGFSAGAAQSPVAPAIAAVMSDSFIGIPVPIYLLAAFGIVAIALQNASTVGRRLYAAGSSPGAARVLGLPMTSLTTTVYAISGLCSGTAGILLAGYSSAATMTMGDPFLLPSIAAVVIGGTRVTGGRGLYLGTFAGAIFLSTLATIITVLSLSQGFRDLIQGTIIVLALLSQNGRRSRAAQ